MDSKQLCHSGNRPCLIKKKKRKQLCLMNQTMSLLYLISRFQIYKAYDFTHSVLDVVEDIYQCGIKILITKYSVWCMKCSDALGGGDNFSFFFCCIPSFRLSICTIFFFPMLTCCFPGTPMLSLLLLHIFFDCSDSRSLVSH